MSSNVKSMLHTKIYTQLIKIIYLDSSCKYKEASNAFRMSFLINCSYAWPAPKNNFAALQGITALMILRISEFFFISQGRFVLEKATTYKKEKKNTQ